MGRLAADRIDKDLGQMRRQKYGQGPQMKERKRELYGKTFQLPAWHRERTHTRQAGNRSRVDSVFVDRLADLQMM